MFLLPESMWSVELVYNIYIYIDIHRTLIAWVWFLWSRPQTTSHVVLVFPGGDCVRAEMEQGPLV